METREIVKYKQEVCKLPKIKYPEGWNEEIVETAGFVPLEVRFKQMEQAGFRAQFFESEFSSKDVTDMYLNHPEFDITPEDDVEEAYEKMQLRAAYIASVKEAIKARNAGLNREEEAATSEAKSSKKKTEKYSEEEE